ncbi:MAG TPA: hypothetical protein VGQ08_15855 [Nitrospiraceae bacterium]|jgi:glycerol uptake facilitator-like aquaporin|nr:hypothetical protein [Nitrospiraceae bacterium]
MDATNNHTHSRRAAKGITMLRGAVMVGSIRSRFNPSVTIALTA